MTDQPKYRLVTRPDFDGVVCGALLHEREMIEDVVFAQPREMQHGSFPVSAKDVTTNLPYRDEVHLCFDHHSSEIERVGQRDNLIIDDHAPSTARVVYRHYGGKEGFPLISEDLMAAVDQADSANYGEEDILAPDGWTILNFLLDGRSGLHRRTDFRIPNEQFMIDMMTYCRHHPIADILEIPDVQERALTFQEEHELGEMQLRRKAEVIDNVVKIDLRKETPLHMVNRFLIYAIYPQCNVSVQLNPMANDVVEVAVGRSILDRSSAVDIGSLLLKYNGGGHRAVGTCRVSAPEADHVVDEIVTALTA